MIEIGEQMHDFARQLWGIDRSLTGEGVRETLQRIKDEVPELEIKSVPSGEKAFDWTVPKEWKVTEAYIITPSGERICDYSESNLHLVGYSVPFSGVLTREELDKHLYSLPDQPSAIPYITSYYQERWGFCLPHSLREKLQPGDYKVVINTELFDGVLNYGEILIPGVESKEIFLSTYICHPSMANNELSGPTVTTYLIKWIAQMGNRRYSYRVVFIPETIGSIVYISRNLEQLKSNVTAGFNVTCVGDDRTYSYLPSRRGGTVSDKAAEHVLKWVDPDHQKYTWLDRGSDERQYCSPGVDLPIATIMRSKYGEYPEYHTSLDDLENVVTASGLEGGFTAIQRALEVIERDQVYRTTFLCEPQMGKRGLYPTLSTKGTKSLVKNMMDFISLCDGTESLLEIAEELNLPVWDLYGTLDTLLENGVVELGSAK